jgi:hypothetical protein
MTPADEPREKPAGEDSDESDAARRPSIPDQLAQPVEWLIYRLMYFTEEQLQDGPVNMVTRAAALAQLYQAKALEGIAQELSVGLTDIIARLDNIHSALLNGIGVRF